MLSDMFVSYTMSYDHYVGEISIAALPMEVQDDLIKSVFDPERDFREAAVHHNVIKRQAEGLWTVVVLVGTALEEQKRIDSFDNRSSDDIDQIISALSGTNLWLRLEEAFPPFNSKQNKSEYDWQELEPIQMEAVAELAGEALTVIKSGLLHYLSRRPLSAHRGFDDRMPYHAFKPLYEQGKVKLVVDKGIAPLAGAAGIISTRAPYFVLFSIGMFFASPVLWIAYGALYAIACLAIAVAIFRHSKTITIKAVRRAAIEDQRKYRWLLSKSAIWLKTAGLNGAPDA